MAKHRNKPAAALGQLRRACGQEGDLELDNLAVIQLSQKAKFEMSRVDVGKRLG